MDGWVTIGFKGDTKQLDRDLRNAEKQLRQFEKEAQSLSKQKVKIETDLSHFELAKKLIEEETDAELKNAQTTEQVNAVLEMEQQNLKLINEGIKNSTQEYENINKKIKENAINQQLTNTKVEEFKNKISQVKGFDNVKTKMGEIGNSIDKVIKKVVRWGIAIFGIRSAYNFVRQAMSTLSGYNEQIGTDVEYIRFALATTLQPVIETLINLAYKLLAYTAYIAKAWFGVNLFAKASTKAFQNTNKAVKATNKSAKELSKTLAGFDEMNILQENGSVSGGGGGGGIKAPSIDLSDWQDVEIPGWIKWIADNKDLILSFLGQVAVILATFKLAQLLTTLQGMFGILQGMGSLQIFVLAAGMITILTGIIETISGIVAFIKDPSWENFDKILNGLETILIGVGIAMLAIPGLSTIAWITIAIGAIGKLIGGVEGLTTALDLAGLAMIAFNATNPVGWITLAVGAIGGIINALFGEEEQTKKARKAQEDYTKAKERAREANDAYVYAVDNSDRAQKQLDDTIKKHKISTEQLNDIVKRGEENYRSLSDTEKEVYKAYIDNESAQKKLKDATKELNNARKEEAKKDIETQISKAKTKESYDKLKESVIGYYKDGKITAKETMEYFDKAMSNMDRKTKETFAQSIPTAIKEAFGTEQYEGEIKKFKSWFENRMEKINLSYTYTIETKFKTDGAFKTSGSLQKRAKGGIFYPYKLPKLALGGVINRPGAGVPYHGATIAEKGAEAVLPLTDSQQMMLLGEAIGKYITVNANITNTMNGRVISRELQKINNENDFAYNR